MRIPYFTSYNSLSTPLESKQLTSNDIPLRLPSFSFSFTGSRSGRGRKLGIGFLQDRAIFREANQLVFCSANESSFGWLVPPLRRCKLRLETVVVCPARSENRVRERVRAQRPSNLGEEVGY